MEQCERFCADREFFQVTGGKLNLEGFLTCQTEGTHSLPEAVTGNPQELRAEV